MNTPSHNRLPPAEHDPASNGHGSNASPVHGKANPQPTCAPRDPSPDEIRRACLLIQSTWRKSERHLRAQFRPPWTDVLSTAGPRRD